MAGQGHAERVSFGLECYLGLGRAYNHPYCRNRIGYTAIPQRRNPKSRPIRIRLINMPREKVGEPFDERANEDRYFAAKEHALVEEMRLELQKAQAARRQAEIATCPSVRGNCKSTRSWESSLSDV